MRKKFDSVKFQRQVREELGKKYSSNREAFIRELREKYSVFRKEKVAAPVK